MSAILFEPVKAASRISPRVIVAVSGGKDSAVTLDLCARFFGEVHAFFMYLVPGLSFQEAVLRHYEARYGIVIDRVPHPMVSEWFRYGVFRKEDGRVPLIKVPDIYRHVRLKRSAWWVAAGERIADSTIRRAMIKRSSSIDETRGRVYPVAHFRKADVLRYIERQRLKVAPEARVLGHSLRGLEPREMALIKRHYPADFERIRAWYPFVEAAVFRFEHMGVDDGVEQASAV